MSIFTEAQGAFDECTGSSLLGQACTIGGVSCTAVFTAIQENSVFSDFSTRENITSTALVSKTQLQSAPADRATVVLGTQSFFVHRVDDNPTHFLLYLSVFS